MDILASTSSIWNLCVISLDRYMAGKDPIGYRDRVSKSRITIAIILVWVMSACESFTLGLFFVRFIVRPNLYLAKTCKRIEDLTNSRSLLSGHNCLEEV